MSKPGEDSTQQISSRGHGKKLSRTNGYKRFPSDLDVSLLVARCGDLPLTVAIGVHLMDLIDGVNQVQGDITNVRTAEVRREMGLMFYGVVLACRVSNMISLTRSGGI
ncbi:hypothetical protein MUK42_32771 [Musa troglodytarum]|uniref:Uncharacterized protein n=1 Tax=Musa troglodytarum TaxID=320322 RepID=A0A9E7IAH6_9LILI|nr:hypothetical protein MUK42_32771 [Musa troglodytarum]